MTYSHLYFLKDHSNFVETGWCEAGPERKEKCQEAIGKFWVGKLTAWTRVLVVEIERNGRV